MNHTRLISHVSPSLPSDQPHALGRIVKSYGRRYGVLCADGTEFDCTTRKKRTDFACGDWVYLNPSNAQQAVIEDYLPRQSLLYRADAFRSKLIAANVTQLLIVVAATPSFSIDFVSSCLIAAEAAAIPARILCNKADLPLTETALTQLAPFAALGYEVLPLSAFADLSPLRTRLHGHVSLFIGQSGMGKSTLTNALVPTAAARTGDISTALDSGKHTTTHAQLYQLDQDSAIIDSPGLQEFGLYHLNSQDLAQYFVEFRPYLGQCRFHNCQHRTEPHCAILAAAAAGQIHQSRLEFYQRLLSRLQSAPKSY